MSKYNFKSFDSEFPDDAACLDFIFRARFAGKKCECGKSNCFHRVAKRRSFACAFCGAQIYSTAGTPPFALERLLKINVDLFVMS